MKTTIELDDELFRRTKAQAALRGQTLKAFFDAALRDYLGDLAASSVESRGWRRVFGTAAAADIEEVDAVIREEFQRVDLEGWT